MSAFGQFTSHRDISGMGFGTTFLPAQKCVLEFARSGMLTRGVACELAYTYQCDMAEATFTLKDHDGQPVAGLKFAERWEDFEDKGKPLIHTVFNYDVYIGTPSRGWLQAAFMQVQESRGVPPKLRAAIHDGLHDMARCHNLFPKVSQLVFGVR